VQPVGVDGRVRRADATRRRILDCAEELFAEHGYDGVSLRKIARAAGIQMSLIQYHFASKRGLYQGVWDRRRGDYILADQDPNGSKSARPPSLEARLSELIGHFQAGPLEMLKTQRGRRHLRLIQREISDPKEGGRGILQHAVDPSMAWFAQGLGELLPALSAVDRHVAYTLTRALTFYMLVCKERTVRLSRGLITQRNYDSALRSAIKILVYGLREYARERAA
jgi:AcrR family transcriptional regulator